MNTRSECQKRHRLIPVTFGVALIIRLPIPAYSQRVMFGVTIAGQITNTFLPQVFRLSSFHKDAADLFADLRIGNRFERFAVNSHAERKQFGAALRNALQRIVAITPRPPAY
jgi:hypothetical protein